MWTDGLLTIWVAYEPHRPIHFKNLVYKYNTNTSKSIEIECN